MKVTMLIEIDPGLLAAAEVVPVVDPADGLSEKKVAEAVARLRAAAEKENAVRVRRAVEKLAMAASKLGAVSYDIEEG